MHTNDYPIVREDIIACHIKLLGLVEKVSFILDVEENERLGVVD